MAHQKQQKMQSTFRRYAAKVLLTLKKIFFAVF